MPESNRKSVEWLEMIVSSEFEKYEKWRQKTEKSKADEFVWPIFSGILSLGIALEYNIQRLLLISFIYLVIYYLFYKLLIKGLGTRSLKELKRMIDGVNGKPNDKSFEKEREKFEKISLNHLLLSNIFIEKYEQNKPTIASIKSEYLIEALCYLKIPIENMRIIMTTKTYLERNISYNSNTQNEDLSLEFYRIDTAAKIVGDTIAFLENTIEVSENKDLANHVEKYKSNFGILNKAIIDFAKEKDIISEHASN